MAKSIQLTSGSIFNGSPITFAIVPNIITGKDDDGNTIYPSFHNIITEVTCGIDGGNYDTFKMYSSILEENGDSVSIDISSALRTFRDNYEYSPTDTTFPIVRFFVTVYDEYMFDGETYSNVDSVTYPAKEEDEQPYLATLFGAFSDIERLSSNGSLGVKKLSCKPSSAPQVAFVNEEYVYAPSYSTEQLLLSSSSLVNPTSKTYKITTEGAQTVEGQLLYALPASESKNRQEFRFVNRFGVIESVSIPRAYSKKLSATSTVYIKSRQETFNTVSGKSVLKENGIESWNFTTDALDENWLHWFLHDFLLSEHVWLKIGGNWISCILSMDDDNTFIDHTKYSQYTVAFTATLDISGSPFLSE